MRVVVDRDAALAAVGAVQSIADRKHTVPILHDVLLTADAEGLSVSASNLDVWATAGAMAQTVEEGAAAVPAEQLYDLIRNLPPGGEIELSTEAAPAGLQVRCGRSKTRLLTLPPADFPPAPFVDADAVEVKIRADVLLRLLERVAFACSTDETRWMLTGVHLAVVEGDDGPRLRAAGCQPTLMAWADAPAPAEALQLPRMSLPRRLVAELRRMLDGRTHDIALRTNGRLLGLRVGDRELVAKLMDGDPPAFWRYFQTQTASKVDVAVGDLKASAKRCLMMASDKQRSVRLGFDPDSVRLSAASGELGEAEEELDAKIADAPASIGVNAGQLLEIAGQITGSRLVMRMPDPVILVLIDDPADPACGYLTTALKG